MKGWVCHAEEFEHWPEIATNIRPALLNHRGKQYSLMERVSLPDITTCWLRDLEEGNLSKPWFPFVKYKNNIF